MKEKIEMFANMIAGVVFLFSVCAIDSDSNIFFASALISAIWLFTSAWRHGLIGGEAYAE